MRVEKVELNDIVLNKLISFSIEWEKENSCYGYRRNQIDDIKNETIYLAYEDLNIVGYLFGHIEIADKESCTIKKGSKCFEVSELFVQKEYRSKGIGKRLFTFMENDQKNNCEYICLTTATKNCRAILHFYVEEVGMNFWSARLFKKVEE